MGRSKKTRTAAHTDGDAIAARNPGGVDVAVVYSTDGNPDDVRRLVWSLRSLLRYSSARFDIFILTESRDLDIASYVPQVKEHGTLAYVHDMADILGGLSMSAAEWRRPWPFAALYRLGIPLHSAFAGYRRILYLDTDTLVLSAGIDTFMSADLSGAELGCVIDTVQEAHGRIRGILENDIDPAFASVLRERYGDTLLLRPYVNSGVVLWDLPAIRKDLPWYKERLRAFWEALRRGKCPYIDQDFINAMMVVNTSFSMVYNWFIMGGVETPECVVRHYCGYQPGQMEAKVRALGLDAPAEGSVASVSVPTTGLGMSKCADKAYMLCFTGNVGRAEAAMADMKRVGIPAEQIWQFPTPFDKYFSDSVPHTGQFDGKPGWANSWFGHYRAMKTAYELGCKTVLIMEDDCRFMNDVAKVDEIAADLPADFDFALFDHFYCWWDDKNRKAYEELRSRRVTKYWSTFEYGFYSAACYLISRRAMERLIWLHESLIDPRTQHRMMRVTDYWHNRGNLGPLNLYFCTPNCAIQRNQDAASTRLSDTSGINGYYKNMGIQFDAYAGG